MAEIEWLANRLRGDGYLTVRETTGWKSRGRPGSFAPQGVLIHHTAFHATQANPAPALSTVINGRGEPDPLPGPLCHVLIDRLGVCHVIASGRANHAGEARASGPMPAGDGNTMYVGIEIDYAPQEPYNQSPSTDQWVAAINAAAAIVSRLGHGSNYVRYHKETSVTGKWDPGNFTPGGEWRNHVQAVIDNRW